MDPDGGLRNPLLACGGSQTDSFPDDKKHSSLRRLSPPGLVERGLIASFESTLVFFRRAEPFDPVEKLLLVRRCRRISP